MANNNRDEIIQVEISELDYRFILHIKSLREQKKLSQRDLSGLLGLGKNFVGNVESFTQPQKYNFRHLTLLAKVFKYKSVSKLFDFPTPEHDWVRLTLRISPALKKDGTPSKEKNVEVINVEPWLKGKE